MFNLPDFREFKFTEEALKLFQRIWLSCVYHKNVLQNCSRFLEMDAPATLADTYEQIKTGSCTIGCYKAFSESSGKSITKKDVIMAFADEVHLEAMKEMYIYGGQTDFWHEKFSLDEFLISHIIKPAIVDVSDHTRLKLFSKRYNNLLLKNLYYSRDPNRQIVHLVHFGVVVESLDYTTEENQTIIAELLSSQDEIFDDFNTMARKSLEIDYQFLNGIYERNFRFYNSLRS